MTSVRSSYPAKDSRGTSTKTRIETYCVHFIAHFLIYIREAHPLKQGLKHAVAPLPLCGSIDSRGTSTKTRIETYCISHDTVFVFLHIREAHPLKQGLKLIIHNILPHTLKFERHIH